MSHPVFRVRQWTVTIRPVRRISRKGQVPEEWAVGFVDGVVLPFVEERPLRTVQSAVSVSGILRGHTPTDSFDSELKIWS